MEIHEFHRWYAGLPIEERFNRIGTFSDSTLPPTLTIYDVHKRLKELDDITRPYDIERSKILGKVDWYKIQKEER